MARRLALAFLVTVAMPGGARADVDVIRDAERLQNLFSDRTVYARFLNGDEFKEYYAPDGQTAYFVHQCLYSGRWWIEELSLDFGIFAQGTPVICFAYPALNQDDPSCFAVGGRTGRERLYAIAGVPENTGIPTAWAYGWRAGNPEPLAVGVDDCPSASIEPPDHVEVAETLPPQLDHLVRHHLETASLEE